LQLAATDAILSTIKGFISRSFTFPGACIQHAGE
jgi:hypothetical protein